VIAGKYRLRRLVGKGAMGVVWAAVNERTEREVALKLINSQDDELRRRLLREARACGRLDHRNIVEIYDVGETADGDPFLVMPLLTGETLADRLDRDGLLLPSIAARIASDIAGGLSAAHAAGIVHRDLKPANVFLHHEIGGDDAFVVKVLDFGVSKMLNPGDAAATMAAGAIGSPLYMSPEQARGDRDVDHRADLWATGIVLFEMLTGTRPFHGDTMFAVAAQILTGPIPTVLERAPQIDPALGEVVARCLERKADRRVSTAAELVALLRPFAGTRERTVPSVSFVAPRPPLLDEEGPTAFFKKPTNMDELEADLFGRVALAGTVLIPDEAAVSAELGAASSPSLTSTTPLVQPAAIAPKAEALIAPAAAPRSAIRWVGVAVAVIGVLALWAFIYGRITRAPPGAAPPSPAREEPSAAPAPIVQPPAPASAAALDPAPTPSAAPTPIPSAAPAVERPRPTAASSGRPAAPASSGKTRAHEIIRETPF
jgi:serine/threonine-protein kinase